MAKKSYFRSSLPIMIDTVDLSSIDKFLEATGNYYRVFQIVLRGGMGNFDGGGTFYQVVGT